MYSVSTSFSSNQWVHLTLTIDKSNSNLTFYKNGLEIGTFTNAFFDFNEQKNSDLLIGASKTTNTYFKGFVDDVQIFDSFLNDEHTSKLYDSFSIVPYVSSNQWSHIVANYDESQYTTEIFINGSNIGKFENYQTNIVSNSNPIIFGENYVGEIGDVIAFERPLFDNEIYFMSHNTDRYFKTKPLFHYNFQDISSKSHAFDTSESSNNAIFSKSPLYLSGYSKGSVALDFDGNQSLTVNVSNKYNYNQMIFSSYISTSNDGSLKSLLTKENEFDFYIHNNTLCFVNYQNDAQKKVFESTNILTANYFNNGVSIADVTNLQKNGSFEIIFKQKNSSSATNYEMVTGVWSSNTNHTKGMYIQIFKTAHDFFIKVFFKTNTDDNNHFTLFYRFDALTADILNELNNDELKLIYNYNFNEQSIESGSVATLYNITKNKDYLDFNVVSPHPQFPYDHTNIEIENVDHKVYIYISSCIVSSYLLKTSTDQIMYNVPLSLNDNDFMHVGVIIDRFDSNLHFYREGVLMETRSNVEVNILPSSSNIVIGKEFVGSMTDIKLDLGYINNVPKHLLSIDTSFYFNYDINNHAFVFDELEYNVGDVLDVDIIPKGDNSPYYVNFHIGLTNGASLDTSMEPSSTINKFRVKYHSHNGGQVYLHDFYQNTIGVSTHLQEYYFRIIIHSENSIEYKLFADKARTIPNAFSAGDIVTTQISLPAKLYLGVHASDNTGAVDVNYIGNYIYMNIANNQYKSSFYDLPKYDVVEPLGIYSFDESTGLIAEDKSHFKNNGILVNNPIRKMGTYDVQSKGIVLNASQNQYADINGEIYKDIFLDEMTLSAWVYTSNDNIVSQNIVSKQNTFNWGINSNGYVYFNNVTSTIVNSSNNTWTHLSTTIDGVANQITFYDNFGNIDTVEDVSMNISINNSNIYMGTNFTGVLDNVIIHKGVLDKESISNLAKIPDNQYTPSNIESDIWSHVAAVYNKDMNMICIYQNGQYTGCYENYLINHKNIGINSNDMFIATTGNNYTYYDGLMDDIRIYNKSLSHDDINDLYKLYQDNVNLLVGEFNPIYNNGVIFGDVTLQNTDTPQNITYYAFLTLTNYLSGRKDIYSYIQNIDTLDSSLYKTISLSSVENTKTWSIGSITKMIISGSDSIDASLVNTAYAYVVGITENGKLHYFKKNASNQPGNTFINITNIQYDPFHETLSVDFSMFNDVYNIYNYYVVAYAFDTSTMTQEELFNLAINNKSIVAYEDNINISPETLSYRQNKIIRKAIQSTGSPTDINEEFDYDIYIFVTDQQSTKYKMINVSDIVSLSYQYYDWNNNIIYNPIIVNSHNTSLNNPSTHFPNFEIDDTYFYSYYQTHVYIFKYYDETTTKMILEHYVNLNDTINGIIMNNEKVIYYSNTKLYTFRINLDNISEYTTFVLPHTNLRTGKIIGNSKYLIYQTSDYYLNVLNVNNDNNSYALFERFYQINLPDNSTITLSNANDYTFSKNMNNIDMFSLSKSDNIYILKFNGTTFNNVINNIDVNNDQSEYSGLNTIGNIIFSQNDKFVFIRAYNSSVVNMQILVYKIDNEIITFNKFLEHEGKRLGGYNHFGNAETHGNYLVVLDYSLHSVPGYGTNYSILYVYEMDNTSINENYVYRWDTYNQYQMSGVVKIYNNNIYAVNKNLYIRAITYNSKKELPYPPRTYGLQGATSTQNKDNVHSSLTTVYSGLSRDTYNGGERNTWSINNMPYGNGVYTVIANTNYNAQNSGHWISGVFSRYIAGSPAWHTSSSASEASPQWIAIQLPESIVLKKYRMYDRKAGDTDSSNTNPRVWKLYGSDNIYATNWVELDSYDNLTKEQVFFYGDIKEYPLDNNTQSFSAYKMEVLYTQSSHLTLAELILFGEPNNQPTPFTNFSATSAMGITNIRANILSYENNNLEVDIKVSTLQNTTTKYYAIACVDSTLTNEQVVELINDPSLNASITKNIVNFDTIVNATINYVVTLDKQFTPIQLVNNYVVYIYVSDDSNTGKDIDKIIVEDTTLGNYPYINIASVEYLPFNDDIRIHFSVYNKFVTINDVYVAIFHPDVTFASDDDVKAFIYLHDDIDAVYHYGTSIPQNTIFNPTNVSFTEVFDSSISNTTVPVEDNVSYTLYVIAKSNTLTSIQKFKKTYMYGEYGEIISWKFDTYPSDDTQALQFANATFVSDMYKLEGYDYKLITPNNTPFTQNSFTPDGYLDGDFLGGSQTLETVAIPNAPLPLLSADTSFTFFVHMKLTFKSAHGNYFFVIGDNTSGDHLVLTNGNSNSTALYFAFNSSWNTDVSLGNFSSGQDQQICVVYDANSNDFTFYYKLSNSSSISSTTYNYVYGNTTNFKFHLNRELDSRFDSHFKRILIFENALTITKVEQLFDNSTGITGAQGILNVIDSPTNVRISNIMSTVDDTNQTITLNADVDSSAIYDDTNIYSFVTPSTYSNEVAKNIALSEHDQVKVSNIGSDTIIHLYVTEQSQGDTGVSDKTILFKTITFFDDDNKEISYNLTYMYDSVITSGTSDYFFKYQANSIDYPYFPSLEYAAQLLQDNTSHIVFNNVGVTEQLMFTFKLSKRPSAILIGSTQENYIPSMKVEGQWINSLRINKGSTSITTFEQSYNLTPTSPLKLSFNDIITEDTRVTGENITNNNSGITHSNHFGLDQAINMYSWKLPNGDIIHTPSVDDNTIMNVLNNNTLDNMSSADVTTYPCPYIIYQFTSTNTVSKIVVHKVDNMGFTTFVRVATLSGVSLSFDISNNATLDIVTQTSGVWTNVQGMRVFESDNEYVITFTAVESQIIMFETNMPINNMGEIEIFSPIAVLTQAISNDATSVYSIANLNTFVAYVYVSDTSVFGEDIGKNEYNIEDDYVRYVDKTLEDQGIYNLLQTEIDITETEAMNLCSNMEDCGAIILSGTTYYFKTSTGLESTQSALSNEDDSIVWLKKL